MELCGLFSSFDTTHSPSLFTDIEWDLQRHVQICLVDALSLS